MPSQALKSSLLFSKTFNSHRNIENSGYVILVFFISVIPEAEYSAYDLIVPSLYTLQTCDINISDWISISFQFISVMRNSNISDLEDYPSIKLLLFHSNSAYKYFKRFFKNTAVPYICISSPSGQNRKGTEEKATEWRTALSCAIPKLQGKSRLSWKEHPPLWYNAFWMAFLA